MGMLSLERRMILVEKVEKTNVKLAGYSIEEDTR